jgi:PTS system nitrogen regulatory IIA component
MLSLSEFLTPDRIVVMDDPGDRDAVIDAAARLLADASSQSVSAVVGSLRQRERMGSTAIGHGVAIPHGRSDFLTDTRAAFLRLRPGVDFNAGDGMPVDLVFAMSVPEHFTQRHLQLLSDLAQRFGDAGFRAALRQAPDADALRSTLLANA